MLRTGRLGLPSARVRERLGAFDSEKAVSLIAIHTHKIPNVFQPRRASRGRARAARRRWPAARTGASSPLVTIDPADAKDHDDAVHAEPDPDPDNRGGFILTVAIADVAAYVRPGSALDREALDARQFGLFPRPRRADAAGAHLQRSLLAAAARGPARARRAHGHRRRRAQALAHVSTAS